MLNKLKNFLNRFQQRSKLSFRSLRKLDYRYYIGITLVALALVFGVIFIFRAPQTTEAAWWNITWSYRKSIAITNSSGSTLTDYQIQILDDEDLSALVSAGKLESTLADLRFTDTNHRVLDYWIEDDTNASVNVWIKVPSIPTIGTTVYMYYGNSSASDESDATKIIGNSGNPGTSCTDIKNNRDAATGLYYITGNSSEFQVYCDMDTDDGGWTLVLQNNYGLTSPQPTWEEAVNSNNITGSFGTTLTAFDVLVGVANWETLGTTARLEQGASPTSLSHQAYYTLTLDEGNYYALTMSNENVTIQTEGVASPGMYTTHNNKPLTTYDADHDAHADNCSTFYGNTAWWYVACWSGNFWGYNNYAYWSGAGACVAGYCYNWGGIWLRGTVSAITISIGALASEENAPGPIGYWNFDEGYGTTAYDSTGYKNDGTITGATWVKNGKKGGALSFDGTNDNYIDCGNDISLKPPEVVSMSFWAKPIAYQVSSARQNVGFLQYGGYTFWQYSTLYVAEMNKISDTRRHKDLSLSLLPLDTWTNVTIIFDGTGGEIWVYKNGKLFDSSTELMGDMVYSGNFNIGKMFNGLIDEVRIYDRALSENEVKQLYNQNAGSFNVGNTRIPRSCADQLAMSPGSSSGTYTIDPGYGVDPFEVYCDMETAGGGWTLVGKFKSTDSDHWTYADSAWSDDSTFNDDSSELNTTITQSVKFKSYATVPANDIWVGTPPDTAPASTVWMNCHDLTNLTLDDAFTSIGGLGGYSDGVYVEMACGSATYDDTYACAGCKTPTYFGLNVDDEENDPARLGWSKVSYSSGLALARNGCGTIGYAWASGGTCPTPNQTDALLYVRDSNVVTTTPGLVLDLPFESQSSNTTYDKSGYENDGTITGATWKTAVNCKEGRCFEFDGSGNYIDAGEGSGDFDFGTGDFTLAFWAKLNSHSDASGLVTKTDGSYWSGIGFSFTTPSSPDSPYFRVVGTGGAIELNTSLGDSYGWKYFTGMRDGNTFKVYIDGVLITSTTNDVGNINNDVNLRIARGNSGYYNGLIDQVKIFNVALTQREIMMEMNAGKPGPVLDMDFNEGGGDTAYDKSGFENNGDLYGTCPGASTCPTWKTADNCVSGSCLSFDGGDSIVLSPITNLYNLTVSTWARTADWGAIGWADIIDSWQTGDNDWIRLALNTSGELTFAIDTDDTDSGRHDIEYDASGLADNTWHQIVGVRNINEDFSYLYVDGDLVDSLVHTDNTALSPLTLALGQRGDNTGAETWDGEIDEVKVYPYALTPQEIKQEYIQSKGQFGQTNAIGIKTNPGSSCADILARKTDAPDGKYWIDLTGGSISDEFEVYCDMTREGGGWTLAARIYKSNSDFLYADAEWNTTGTEFGSIEADGNDFRSSVFGNLDKTQLMICDDYTYGCNVDSDFSSLETLSETIANAPEGKTAVALTKTMETYNWGTNYCQLFWNSSTYRINLEDNDGSPRARLVSTNNNDGVGGIGYLSSVNMYTYNGTCNGDDTDIPDYVELYVKESTVVSNDIGPVLDMDFDQYSGGVYLDKSGNGHNGTPSGSPTWKTAVNCKKGRCLDFDDSETDIVTIPANSTFDFTGDYTLEAWIKPDDVSQYRHGIMGKYSSNGWGLQLNYDKINFGSHTCSNFDGTTSLLIGNWYHVVGIYKESADDELYVNGRLDSTGNLSDGNCGDDTSAVVIGTYRTSTSEEFDGIIDQVRIYDRALTQVEISNSYNGGAPIGWWRFDEGADNLCSDGTDVCDNSGEGNNGTASSSPVWITDTSECKQGGCLDFDGSDDYVEIDNTDSEFDFIDKDFTMSFWVNLDNNTNEQTVLDTESAGWAGWNIRYDMSGCSNTFCFGGSGGERALLSNVSSINEWHHIVATYSESDTDLKGYLDGKLDKTTDIDLDITAGVDNTLLIGIQTTSGTRAFNGSLDDVRIYNYALAPSQIKEIYNGGLIRFK